VQRIAFGSNQSPPNNLGDAQSLQFTADSGIHTVWFCVNPMAVSPDGKLLAELGYPLNNVAFWDTNSGQKLQTITAHKPSTNYFSL